MLQKTSFSWSCLKAVFRKNTRCMHQSQKTIVPRRKYLSRLLLIPPKTYKIDCSIGKVGKKPQCSSQLLLMNNELIHSCHPGSFYFMPNALRSLEKLIRLIDEELQEIGAQKISMPTLVSSELWKQTERWDSTELFKLSDRHSRWFCLGPTHEELITSLFASQVMSYKRLPVMYYQITRKFRDEMVPRFALLRSREFEMKDLYTFDTDLETATETYNLICDTYIRIFDRLGLPALKTEGATGNIGGKSSHEFHLLAGIGEDTVYQCSSCGFAANKELMDEDKMKEDKSIECPKCSTLIHPTHGIEVGHAFLLGTKYSSVLNASFRSKENNSVYAEMGCYGLGVTRILQAGVEVLSKGSNIVWPSIIAPYQVCITPNLDRTKQYDYDGMADNLYDKLTEISNVRGEIVIFDSGNYTLGKKVTLATQQGYPYIVIVGKKALNNPPLYEVINTRLGETEYLSLEQLTDKLSQIPTI